MKINKHLMTTSLVALSTVLASGCSIMSPIGKQDFTCPNGKKGGVCAGPRTIYELTHSRANLEDVNDLGDFDGYVITTNEEGNAVAVKRDELAPGESKPNKYNHILPNEDGVRAVLINDRRHQYEPRDLAQQTTGQYQAPKVIAQQRTKPNSQDPFHQWPANQEPLAPEPLSVLKPPKVMRILFASYKDDKGNVHLPGYLYTQVEQETWAFGEAANLRPQRVIPTQIMEQTQDNAEGNKYRQQGVSALEHVQY